jgi:hypothetical protein
MVIGRTLARYSTIGITSLALGGFAAAQNSGKRPFRPEWQPPSQGIIPDADTAVKVGVAALGAMGPVSKREVETHKPWEATLADDGNWEVRGTLPKHSPGGTTVVVIAKNNERIVAIYGEQ